MENPGAGEMVQYVNVSAAKSGDPDDGSRELIHASCPLIFTYTQRQAHNASYKQTNKIKRIYLIMWLEHCHSVPFCISEGEMGLEVELINNG